MVAKISWYTVCSRASHTHANTTLKKYWKAFITVVNFESIQETETKVRVRSTFPFVGGYPFWG